ncbi:unnamed protein product [Brassica rapa]|uniref:Uncharacterized protein n=2 Tax=Brassica TaxID=3705 RepID=A0A8D9HDX6_BRACM|nr:unnamed protein product [Brassica napus]CAG7897440.1 unnamed protein product [Brassica rapa]
MSSGASQISDLAVKTDEKIDRAYPRDFMKVGRVVVHLKREDETLLNPAITSKTGGDITK